MGNTYDEKILCNVANLPTEVGKTEKKGIFVVDPNKVVDTNGDVMKNTEGFKRKIY